MAAARFPVVSVARAPHLPVAPEPDSGAGSWAEIPYPRELEFTWRFMSADNRGLARSLIAGTPDKFANGGQSQQQKGSGLDVSFR